MTAQIRVLPDGDKVILDVNGTKVRLTKDAAFKLSEKLKSVTLQVGRNDWDDILRGFPGIWKRGM